MLTFRHSPFMLTAYEYVLVGIIIPAVRRKLSHDQLMQCSQQLVTLSEPDPKFKLKKPKVRSG